ncbi:MAG: methyltransferase [Pseudomonadota bacterium]
MPGARYVAPWRDVFDRLKAAGQSVSATVEGDDSYPGAVVALPRNRVEALGRVAEALRHVRPGAPVFVDGQKTDGVDALLRALKPVVPVEPAVAKAHGKIARIVRPDELPAALADWEAAAAPRDAGGLTLQAGVFSADGLDPGSAMLVTHLPADLTGRAADYGAGWGALAAALAVRNPGLTALDLIERDIRALDCARANVPPGAANFHWADVTRWTGGPYDLIVTNPPFHTGRAADPGLGQAFLRAAAGQLAPKGRLLLVANAQLPYERVLDAHFAHWQQIVRGGGYKVLAATRPRSARAAA